MAVCLGHTTRHGVVGISYQAIVALPIQRLLFAFTFLPAPTLIRP